MKDNSPRHCASKQLLLECRAKAEAAKQRRERLWEELDDLTIEGIVKLLPNATHSEWCGVYSVDTKYKRQSERVANIVRYLRTKRDVNVTCHRYEGPRRSRTK